MSHLRRWLLPPLTDRLAAGQPVMTREQALDISHQILQLTSATVAEVVITHTVTSVTQLGSDRVRRTNDGDFLRIHLYAQFGDQKGAVYFETNQLDAPALRELVTRAEALGKEMIGSDEQVSVRQSDEQDTYPAVTLWHESTVDALRSAREVVVPQVVAPVRRHGLKTSGFVGVVAQADAVLTGGGIAAYSTETDCEVTVTARPSDGKASGWSGRAARDWTAIDPERIATEAAEICRKNMNAQAIEPGRHTAILGPSAVVQLMRFFALHFGGTDSDSGHTGFSKQPEQWKGSRWHERLFDPRVTITTDPTDPECGFKPWFSDGLVSHPTTWVEGSELRNLAYGKDSLKHQKPYAEMPFGFRLHGGGTTLDQMIAQCDEGIYVNRFSSVDTIDWYTGMMTGVTCDGCFFVRQGKVDRPVKNYRFLMSPFHVLNSLIAIGPSHRAAYGYAPWTEQEKSRARPSGAPSFGWPRRPMVVPPLMVRDFNFAALCDSV